MSSTTKYTTAELLVVVRRYDMPEIKKMYIEAVKWVLGMTEGDVKPHPKPATD